MTPRTLPHYPQPPQPKKILSFPLIKAISLISSCLLSARVTLRRWELQVPSVCRRSVQACDKKCMAATGYNPHPPPHPTTTTTATEGRTSQKWISQDQRGSSGFLLTQQHISDRRNSVVLSHQPELHSEQPAALPDSTGNKKNVVTFLCPSSNDKNHQKKKR